MSKKKYDRLAQDLENAPKVFDAEFKEFDREKFGEEIQNILEKFNLPSEARRQIFSLLMEDADKQQAQKKQS